MRSSEPIIIPNLQNQIELFLNKMSRTDGIELTALSLLRPFWQQLISRLKLAVLLPWLFEKKILAYEEMEDIQTKSSRRERVNVLLDAITRRPLSDAIAFCRKLSRTDGVQDLGRAILASAELPSIDAIGSEEDSEKAPIPPESEQRVDCKCALLIALICVAATAVILHTSVQIDISTDVLQEDRDAAANTGKHKDAQVDISVTSFKFLGQLKLSVRACTSSHSSDKSKQETRHKEYKDEEQTQVPVKKSEDIKDTTETASRLQQD